MARYRIRCWTSSLGKMPDIWPTTYFFYARAIRRARYLTKTSEVTKIDRGAYWYVYDTKTGQSYA